MRVVHASRVGTLTRYILCTCSVYEIQLQYQDQTSPQSPPKLSSQALPNIQHSILLPTYYHYCDQPRCDPDLSSLSLALSSSRSLSFPSVSPLARLKSLEPTAGVHAHLLSRQCLTEIWARKELERLRGEMPGSTTTVLTTVSTTIIRDVVGYSSRFDYLCCTVLCCTAWRRGSVFFVPFLLLRMESILLDCTVSHPIYPTVLYISHRIASRYCTVL